jgi:hypothetical protein
MTKATKRAEPTVMSDMVSGEDPEKEMRIKNFRMDKKTRTAR